MMSHYSLKFEPLKGATQMTGYIPPPLFLCVLWSLYPSLSFCSSIQLSHLNNCHTIQLNLRWKKLYLNIYDCSVFAQLLIDGGNRVQMYGNACQRKSRILLWNNGFSGPWKRKTIKSCSSGSVSHRTNSVSASLVLITILERLSWKRLSKAQFLDQQLKEDLKLNVLAT